MKNTFCNSLKTRTSCRDVGRVAATDESLHGAGSVENVQRESSDCFADWHSKIDFHYIFVGGIRNFIMSEEASRMRRWSGIHWSVILLLDGAGS